MEDNQEHLINKSTNDLTHSNVEKDTVSEVLSAFEMYAMQKSSQSSNFFDINKLTPAQIDKILNDADLSSKRNHELEMATLKADHEVDMKVLNNDNIGFSTLKTLFIVFIVFILIITIALLIYGKEYLDRWLSLVVGLFGGFGISKMIPELHKNNQTSLKKEVVS